MCDNFKRIKQYRIICYIKWKILILTLSSTHIFMPDRHVDLPYSF